MSSKFDEFWQEHTKGASKNGVFWDSFQYNVYLKTQQYVVHNKKSPFDVYIGRSPLPTIWGNPFPMKQEWERPWVVEQYKQWLWFEEEDERCIGRSWYVNTKTREQIHTLKGDILGCWCSPKLCHGHILAYYANFVKEPS